MRRNDLLQQTNEELMIGKAINAVESLGCDPILTDVVVLLSQAQNRLANYVDSRLTNGVTDNSKSSCG